MIVDSLRTEPGEVRDRSKLQSAKDVIRAFVRERVAQRKSGWVALTENPLKAWMRYRENKTRKGANRLWKMALSDDRVKKGNEDGVVVVFVKKPVKYNPIDQIAESAEISGNVQDVMAGIPKIANLGLSILTKDGSALGFNMLGMPSAGVCPTVLDAPVDEPDGTGDPDEEWWGGEGAAANGDGAKDDPEPPKPAAQTVSPTPKSVERRLRRKTPRKSEVPFIGPTDGNVAQAKKRRKRRGGQTRGRSLVVGARPARLGGLTAFRCGGQETHS